MTYLEKLVQKRDDLLDQLLADGTGAGSFGSYSIDGISVSRDRWRQWALESLQFLNELIQQEDPTEIRTYNY